VGVYEEEEESRLFVQGALIVDQSLNVRGGGWQVSELRLAGASYELQGPRSRSFLLF
jgi:hypothetical protein